MGALNTNLDGRRPFHGQQELIEIEAGESELVRFEVGEPTKHVIETLNVYSKRDIFPAHVYYSNSPPPPRANIFVAVKEKQNSSKTQGVDEDEDGAVCFTPTKRRKLMRVLVSDDEMQDNKDEVKDGKKNSPIRRSSRIPNMQSRKTYVKDILKAGKVNKNLFGEGEGGGSDADGDDADGDDADGNDGAGDDGADDDGC